VTDLKINSILDEENRLFLQGKLKDTIIYYDENPQDINSPNNK